MKPKAEATLRGTSIGQLFRKAIRAASALTLVAIPIALASCTRQQYRCKTDTEAYYLLDEKQAQSCEEGAGPYRIEIDSRSRMFDPFNPDRPPMPEDDPQSNTFMRKVDRKKGYPLWEANGRTNIVENPQWWSYLPLDERGVLVLDLEDAVRTALIHSPTYQSNLEQMYLSALDVSSERFLLDSQFFAGWQTSYTSDGPRRGDPTTPDSSSILSTGPSSRGRRPFSMQKKYSSGADLVVGFANSLTWQLAGPNDQSATSLLDFNLLQPLLRQGGRDVVLERLTLAERTLLANVRAMERYRRGFYVQIATGRAPDTQPRRRGGAFGGAGLGGFDILGSVFSNAGGGGGGIGGGGGVPGAGGYLGILQTQLNISNQEDTIIRLQDLYLQLQDNYREALLKMPLSQTEIPSQQSQVAIARQSVYSAQTNLLQQQSTYQGTLDTFKSTLGLPPYLCIEIKGTLLDQFKLISQSLRDRRAIVSDFRAAVGDRNTTILEQSRIERDPTTGEAYRVVDSNPQLVENLKALRTELEPLGGILEGIRNDDIEEARKDIEQLRKNVPIRRLQLNRLKDIANRERGMVCSLLPVGDFEMSFLDGEGLEELPDRLEGELERLTGLIEKRSEAYKELMESFSQIESKLDSYTSARERFADISQETLLGSQDLIAATNENVLAIQLIQARARTESALLPEVDIEPRDAIEIARQNRRDWLNNRANLVNTWRAIEVVADDLESYLDLTVSGDVQNVGDNPLALRSSTGRLRMGLTWDAPITRLQERNNYRQVLIQYQQAKRSYYQYEDNVWASMRATLRQIRQNQLSFEIQRFAVQNAALQISISEDIRQINETLGQVTGPTAAQDAVRGLTDFLSTQNQLIGVYVNFEAVRRSLDLDLGTMEIDSEGLWIDPGPIRADTLGGTLGEAIMEYGLSEGEVLLRGQMKMMEDPPVEVAPSDRLPSVTRHSDDDPALGFPVALPTVGEDLTFSPAGRLENVKVPTGRYFGPIDQPDLQTALPSTAVPPAFLNQGSSASSRAKSSNGAQQTSQASMPQARNSSPLKLLQQPEHPRK